MGKSRLSDDTRSSVLGAERDFAAEDMRVGWTTLDLGEETGVRSMHLIELGREMGMKRLHTWPYVSFEDACRACAFQQSYPVLIMGMG